MRSLKSHILRCVALGSHLPYSLNSVQVEFSLLTSTLFSRSSAPAFAKSRYLICKHLVQAVHHVPSMFFNHVSRECTFPVWRHPDLCPLASPAAGDAQELVGSSAKVVFDGRGKRKGSVEVEGDVSDEGFFEGFQGSEDGDLDDLDAGDGGPESEAESEAEIRGRKDTLIAIAKEMQDITADITNIIDYNVQFSDPHTVKFLCCQTYNNHHCKFRDYLRHKAKAFQSRTAPYPSTFASAHANLMFVHTRPRV